MRVVVSLFFVSLIVFLFAACGNTNVKAIAVQDFFVKAERSSFKVSPDGKYIAYIGLSDNCRNIFVLNVENPDSSRQLTLQNEPNVNYFFWATSDSIVYSEGQLPNANKFFIVDVLTGNTSYLIQPFDHKLRWVQPLMAINGKLLAQMNIRDSTVFDLYRIPLDGSSPILVGQNTHNMSAWIPSADGQVRLAISTDSIEDKVWYRPDENSDFINVLKSDYASSIIPLGAYKNSPSSFYALSNIGKDKLGLSVFDFENSKEVVVSENSNTDLNKEGYLFLKNEVIYTSTTEDKKELTIINAKLKGIYEKLKNIYTDYNIDIIDVDRNFDVVIFKIYTDVNPGRILYYSTKYDKVNELLILNPNLKETIFSKMESISFLSRDGRNISGFLTLPLAKKSKYPVVVLVHDGPGSRDVWGFNQEVQFLASRGYAVFQVNYRGSAGFGKDFQTAGYKQWGGEIQNDISDGVSWLIHQGIADKDRIAIMGTGFGGYSALYAACFNPTLYKCAISSSGYTNLFTYLKEIPPYFQKHLQMYYRIIGDPTKEYELFKAISPLFHAEKIKMPILMFQGARDRYHSVTDINQFVQRVKNNGGNIEYIYFEDEGRRLRKEENIVMYYQQVEEFLNKNL